MLVANDVEWQSDYGQVSDKHLLVYLGLALNREKAVLRYCCKNFSKLMPFILELRRD